MHDYDQTQRKSGRTPKPKDTAAPSIASQIGNAGLARLVQRQVFVEGQGLDRGGAGPAHVDREVARAIEEQRGRGRELDIDARATLEDAMGEDFSDVRVHDDADADGLSGAVSAAAFTTGSDIFFSSGKYDPASSEGRKLLAHELTHVSQQRGATRTSDLTVSEPGDASEVEATAVADKVSAATSAPAASTAAAGVGVSRAGEEEELQASRLDRAAPEEELQATRLDRAAPEEEEQPAQA
jgi:hypothetical protein